MIESIAVWWQNQQSGPSRVEPLPRLPIALQAQTLTPGELEEIIGSALNLTNECAESGISKLDCQVVITTDKNGIPNGVKLIVTGLNQQRYGTSYTVDTELNPTAACNDLAANYPTSQPTNLRDACMWELDISEPRPEDLGGRSTTTNVDGGGWSQSVSQTFPIVSCPVDTPQAATSKNSCAALTGPDQQVHYVPYQELIKALMANSRLHEYYPDVENPLRNKFFTELILCLVGIILTVMAGNAGGNTLRKIFKIS
ncbi:MAG TPA: hypothetical protein DEP87_02290 [Candidatus Pacebacteria bacterium]|nr:hypothetical protein [Candidatus Paceibacterota bacterium]